MLILLPLDPPPIAQLCLCYTFFFQNINMRHAREAAYTVTYTPPRARAGAWYWMPLGVCCYRIWLIWLMYFPTPAFMVSTWFVLMAMEENASTESGARNSMALSLSSAIRSLVSFS